jgi:hypothetical protein
MKSKTVEVPHLGRSVQVRAIPPKLQHAIHANAAKGGRLDSQELMVWKLVYGLKDPNFTEAEARKITQRFTLRVLQPIVDRIDQLSGTDEHLPGADRPHSMRKVTEPAMMATAWLERFPSVVPSGARSRESHGPRPVHRRGSRRGERATSSSSDDPDPETPAARPCACGCGRPRQAGKGQNYFDDECRKRHARERKRKQRAREREEPDRVVERRLRQLTVGDLPTKCRCRCEAIYRDPEHAIVCVACGRPKSLGRLRVNGHDAHLAEVRGWMRNDRATVQQPRAPREWRTRPSRKLSVELRKTRRDELKHEGAPA